MGAPVRTVTALAAKSSYAKLMYASDARTAPTVGITYKLPIGVGTAVTTRMA